MLAGGAMAASTTDEVIRPVDTPASYLATYCTDPRSGPCVNPEGPSPAVRQRKGQQRRYVHPNHQTAAEGGQPVQTPSPVRKRSQQQYRHSARSETSAAAAQSNDGDLPPRMQLVDGSYVLMPAASPTHQSQTPAGPTSAVTPPGSDAAGQPVIPSGVGQDKHKKKKPSGFQFPASKGKRPSATAAAGAAALCRQQQRLASEQQRPQQLPPPHSCTPSAGGVAGAVVAQPPTTSQTDTTQVPMRSHSIVIEEIEDEAASAPQHQANAVDQVAAVIGSCNTAKVATTLSHECTTSGADAMSAIAASPSKSIPAPVALIAAGDDSSATAARQAAAGLAESASSPSTRGADHLQPQGSEELDSRQLYDKEDKEEASNRMGNVDLDTQSNVSSPMSASGESAVSFFCEEPLQQGEAAARDSKSDHVSQLASTGLQLSSQSNPSATSEEAAQLTRTGTYDVPLQPQRESVIEGAAPHSTAGEVEAVQAPRSAPSGQIAAGTADIAAAAAADHMPVRKQRRGGLNGPSAPAAGRRAGRDTGIAVSDSISDPGPISHDQELTEECLQKQQQLQRSAAVREGSIEESGEACAGDDRECKEPHTQCLAASEETPLAQQPADTTAPVSGASVPSDDDAAKADAKLAADEVGVTESCQRIRHVYRDCALALML